MRAYKLRALRDPPPCALDNSMEKHSSGSSTQAATRRACCEEEEEEPISFHLASASGVEEYYLLNLCGGMQYL